MMMTNPSDSGRLVLNDPRRSGEGRPIQLGTHARSGNGAYSTSFGAAGEALSVSATSDADMKTRRTPDAPMSYTMPTGSAGSMEAAAREFGMGHNHTRNGSEDSLPPMLHPSGSPSSTATDDADMKDSAGSHGQHQTIHKCESCAKVYRHPSCLIKHRWEHTMYWKEASKFLMSKHQQVQLLEAAAILVGMDSNARSLPEEKALWPAAVSPPSSGLLGCEHVNFDTLMANKLRNSSMSHDAARMPYGTSAPPAQALPDMHLRAPKMEPLSSSPHMRPHYSHHEAQDTSEDHEETSELDIAPREDGYGLHSGGDMMADMDMDADE
ncbi:hypothetical protein MCAP1_002757 [Malassezia caprae]|uniref:C2H2-type domain-containing protein n=1 Tax=Malassezia caprae TaxID=1381934 RepID=A0AAF0IWD0_9BASI|nr:hypothetical protein MCAP1_002757 [Malassezia caprae]